MEPTQIEQLLIGYLMTSKASEGTRVIVFLAMKTENQMIDMCQFLSDNPEANDKEIMTAAKRIGGPSCGIF